MIETDSGRMQRGYEIAQNCEIKQINENTWLVPSQSGNGSYEVTRFGDTFGCTCFDFQYRVGKRVGNNVIGACKHCVALYYYLQLKAKVHADIEQLEPSVTDEIRCPRCNSVSVIDYGKRGKRVLKQIMQCKDCGRQFRKDGEAFAKLQNEPRIISLILSMHCRNVSLRGICATLEETYGIKVSHQTIHNYLARYAKLLSEYMDSIGKDVKFSGRANVDELYVRVDGQTKYLFAALDPTTRYLLCTILSQKKDYKGARKLFHELAKVTGHNKQTQTIKTITSDALPSYSAAHFSEFVGDAMTKTKNPPKLIFGAGIAKEVNNQMMERVNNTIRTRERNYRGLKADSTPMLPLFIAYYNLVRDHQALGKTPAQAAGINLNLGDDKWIELINRAYQRSKEPKKDELNDLF